MQASTTVRRLRMPWLALRDGWRLGPVLVAGLTLALVAAACGAKVTHPVAASSVAGPAISPARTPSISPDTRAGTWRRLPRAPLAASVSASV